jgi:secondary thiamine-phosphate synthase enzyme
LAKRKIDKKEVGERSVAEQKIISMKTERSVDFYDITAEIETYVKENDMQEGMVLIYTPHTTAGITINENTSPGVFHSFGREFTRPYHVQPLFCF